MRLHVAFKNVEFDQDSTDTIKVKKGEDFTVSLIDSTQPFVWATARRDDVLSLRETPTDGLSATVAATASGTSEIQLQDDRKVEFWISVEVFDLAEVTMLNPTTSEPRTRTA